MEKRSRRICPATRSNILNPAAIDAFTPGSHIFPRDPLWKKSYVKENTEALNKLLVQYSTSDKYYEVDIDFLIEVLSYLPSKQVSGWKWEDGRVKQALKAVKAKGIQNGRLNIRCGKNGEGLELTRQEPGNWLSYGFATSQWLTIPKKNFSDVPTLVVMYEKGEKKLKWDDQPLYLPTLILPKGKFVFMFNYSDTPEEIEDIWT